MASAAVYGFEAIDETLPYLPLAARRALDALGRKLSLEGWRSLPLADRWLLVRSGAGERVEGQDAASIVDRAIPAAARVEAAAEPGPGAPPPELLSALGPLRPLADRWPLLQPLDRYALAKCVARPEKLARAYEEIAGAARLSHVTAAGGARMVDVGAKALTARRAVATACVRTTRAVIDAIASGDLAKGDVLAVARVAGVLAAKRTPELIPLCHPVQTTRAVVDFEPSASSGELRVRATVEAVDRTGVEMEAMVAASVASLTVYDMIKSADRWASVEAVRLEAKSGGKSGELTRPAPPPGVPLVDLREAPLSVDEAIASVRHGGAGAVCVFLGVVRDHSEGRSVVRLDYEAYAGMAIAEMARIAEEISREIPGVRMAVTHRTGELSVGDVAVVCAASAPHRDEAYRACRALVDRVKARVPIWKREHGPEGAWWVGWRDARAGGQEP